MKWHLPQGLEVRLKNLTNGSFKTDLASNTIVSGSMGLPVIRLQCRIDIDGYLWFCAIIDIHNIIFY